MPHESLLQPRRDSLRDTGLLTGPAGVCSLTRGGGGGERPGFIELRHRLRKDEAQEPAFYYRIDHKSPCDRCMYFYQNKTEAQGLKYLIQNHSYHLVETLFGSRSARLDSKSSPFL